MFQQVPPAYPQQTYKYLDDDYISNKNDDKYISNKSPTFYEHRLPRVLSPVHFISDHDSLVPPALFKYKVRDYILPFNTKEDYVVISPLDIFVPAIKIKYDKNLYAFYKNDVCDTPEIREAISKKLYYKFLDKWLYDQHKSGYLLKYFKYSNGEVKLVKDLDDTDETKSEDQHIIDKKVDFIEHNIFRIDDLYVILKQFIAGTMISWCDLVDNTYFIREAIEKTLENKIKKLIRNK